MSRFSYTSSAVTNAVLESPRHLLQSSSLASMINWTYTASTLMPSATDTCACELRDLLP